MKMTINDNDKNDTDTNDNDKDIYIGNDKNMKQDWSGDLHYG